jgi:hypothetical protein
MIDCLCGNIPFLTVSISQLQTSVLNRSQVLQHRNALQQYLFLLSWLAASADSEVVQDSKGKEGARAKPSTKARGKKASCESHLSGQWDWPYQKDRVLQAFLASLKVDSSCLFDSSHEQHRMLDLGVHVVGMIYLNFLVLIIQGL